MRGSGRSLEQRWKPTAQSMSAFTSWPTIITSSPIVLTTRASSGSVLVTRLHEALDRRNASSSPSSSVKRV